MSELSQLLLLLPYPCSPVAPRVVARPRPQLVSHQHDDGDGKRDLRGEGQQGEGPQRLNYPSKGRQVKERPPTPRSGLAGGRLDSCCVLVATVQVSLNCSMLASCGFGGPPPKSCRLLEAGPLAAVSGRRRPAACRRHRRACTLRFVALFAPRRSPHAITWATLKKAARPPSAFEPAILSGCKEELRGAKPESDETKWDACSRICQIWTLPR